MADATVALTGQAITIQRGAFTQVHIALTGHAVTVGRGAMVLGWRFAGVIPSVQGFGLMHHNPSATGAGITPRITGVGYGGATGYGLVPKVRFSGTMSIPNIGRAELIIPSITGGGTGVTGMTAQLAGVIVSITGVGYGGATGGGVIPKVRVAGQLTVSEHASAALVIPRIRGTGTGHRSSDAAYAHLVIPAVISGQQVFNLPIVIPSIIGHGTATNLAVASMQGWAMNVKNGAVTKFTNFPFRAFVRWRDRYYGIGFSGGLYLLEGETDIDSEGDEAPIPWAWETGLEDLGSNAQKGITAVYIEGAIAPGAVVTVIDDKKRRFMYKTHATSASLDRRTYRVIMGKGIRTRNIGIGMSSESGGYMEVNQVSPKYVVSKRNIG